jgi:Tfp pilus assembly protein FimT
LSQIELLVVVAMVGLLGAMAVPNLLDQRPKYRLNGAARQLMGDLLAARMQAVSQHRRVQPVFPDDHLDKGCDDANGDTTVDECEGAARVKDLRADDHDIRVVQPATLWMRMVSSASARRIAGRMVVRRRASTEFPAPGGPSSSR